MSFFMQTKLFYSKHLHKYSNYVTVALFDVICVFFRAEKSTHIPLAIRKKEIGFAKIFSTLLIKTLEICTVEPPHDFDSCQLPPVNIKTISVMLRSGKAAPKNFFVGKSADA